MLAGIDLGGTQVRVALARSDGRLTQAREDQIVSGLKDRITAMVQNALPKFGGRHWGPPPPPAAA